MIRHWLVGVGLVGLLIGGIAIGLPESSQAKTPPNVRKVEALQNLARKNLFSTGAQLYLDRPEPTLEKQPEPMLEIKSHEDPNPPRSFGRNTNANDFTRDTLRGQVESSVAAIQGPGKQERVLAGWIDASALILSDDPTNPDASFTHVSYSRDGAKTFTDLGGLPNPDNQQQWSGDPTIVAVDANHFIVGSLYLPSVIPCEPGRPSSFQLAVAVATVSPDGSTVDLGDPVVAADGGDLCAWIEDETDTVPFPDFLDKPFMSYDAATRTLAMSYTNFKDSFSGLNSGNGQIELVTAELPADPAALTSGDFFPPATVWEEEPFCPDGTDSSEESQCGAVNQGSYPVVTPDGTTYVAWERNWISNLFGNGDECVYLHVAAVLLGTTEPSMGGQLDPQLISADQVNACNGDGGVQSLDTVLISGYSRGIGQDFPRIAYNKKTDQVLFAWNDASEHAFGDIYLRGASRDLGTWSPIQRVNKPDGTLHFLPSLTVGSDGSIRTGWHGRRRVTNARTDYVAEVRKTLLKDAGDITVSTRWTDWLTTASLIDPNFGDYTDSATIGTKTFWTWTDGRLGYSQPFVGWR